MNTGLITLLTVNATDPATGKFDINKYTDLVVKECLVLASKDHKRALEFMWDADDTALTIKQSIKDHFGVK